MIYGKQYDLVVTMPTGREIAKVVLVGMANATHAFNEGGYLRSLTFSELSRDGNQRTIRVTAPADPVKMRAGYAMLFVVDDTATLPGGGAVTIKGVPSVAKIVRVRGFDPIYPETSVVYQHSGGPSESSMGSLYVADNVRYGPFGSGISPTGVYMVVEGTCPTFDPGGLQVLMESKVNASSGDAPNVYLQLYNWQTSSYVDLYSDSRTLPRGSEASNTHERRIAAAYAASDAEKYVDQTNGKVKVKIVWLDLFDWGQTMFDVQVDMVRMGWHP